jgi:hypothetical protein
VTDLITERSIKFIDDHASSAFFLEVAYDAAHWPFQVPDLPSVAADHGRFVQPEESPTATRKDYVAMLERADQGVGGILQALRNRGLERNTLVICMQDNFGEWVSRNAPLFNRMVASSCEGSRGHSPARRQRLGTGQPGLSSPAPLFKIPAGYDTSADGLRFLALAAVEKPEASPMTIVTGRQADLRAGGAK